MANGKKKKITTLIILLIALVLLIIVSVSLTNKNQEESLEGESTSEENIDTTVVNIDTDKVREISYDNEYGSFMFTKDEDERWTYSKDKEFPVDDGKITNILDNINSISYNRIVTENSSDLDQFGLDKPVITASISLDDGSQTSLKFGIATPNYNGYYMMLNEEPTIYAVESSIYLAFDNSEKDMLEIEEIPYIDSNNVRYVDVNSKDGPILEMTYHDEVIGYGGTSNWEITEPYESPQVGDPNTTLEYLGKYTSLAFDECVEYETDDLAEFGLDNPSYVIYLEYFEVVEESAESDSELDPSESQENETEESQADEITTENIDHTFELHIGGTNENGDYYAKTADSDSVNLLNKDIVNELIGVDTFTLVNNYISMINIASVDNVEIRIGEEVHKMEIKRETVTTEEDGETKEEVVEEYYIDGETIEDTEFKDIFQKIIQVQGQQPVAEDYQLAEDQAPVLTITFNRNTETDKTVEVNYYPYDESYYLADTNGNIIFLVDLRTIEEIKTLF